MSTDFDEISASMYVNSYAASRSEKESSKTSRKEIRDSTNASNPILSSCFSNLAISNKKPSNSTQPKTKMMPGINSLAPHSRTSTKGSWHPHKWLSEKLKKPASRKRIFGKNLSKTTQICNYFFISRTDLELKKDLYVQKRDAVERY